MKIYQSYYAEYHYNPDLELIETICFPTTVEMTDKAYKIEQLRYVDLLQRYKTTRLLINAIEFRFPITPAVQEWNAENVAKQEIALGLKKQAIVVSRDFISQMSIEQAIEEEQGKILTEYFDNVQEARDWLIAV